MSSSEDGLIHVAFYDTRAPQRRNWMGVLRAAAVLDGQGVRLHALLASPLPPSVPAHIRVAALELRSPGARCLHANLVRLSHGPGRTYLLKPLLHFVLPPSVRRVLVLDTDVVMIRPLAELWGQFARFGPEAVLGLVAEQSSLYSGNAIGKNGGVQLLQLERMRRSPAYAAALDHYATGRGGAWLGYLGDQTLYSFMAYSHGALFHSLGCEWNRQLSVHFGLEAQRQHACAAPCGLLHANSPDLKCIGTAMQLANGSCVEWRRLQRNSSCVENRGVGTKFRTAAATDWLDGYIARSRNQITDVGKLLDPIADKLLTVSAFIALVELKVAPAWMVVVIVGREIAISGIRSIAAAKGLVMAASTWGKLKTFSQVVAITLLILSHTIERWFRLGNLGRVALWVVLVLSLVSMGQYVVSFAKQVDLGRAS